MQVRGSAFKTSTQQSLNWRDPDYPGACERHALRAGHSDRGIECLRIGNEEDVMKELCTVPVSILGDIINSPPSISSSWKWMLPLVRSIVQEARIVLAAMCFLAGMPAQSHAHSGQSVETAQSGGEKMPDAPESAPGAKPQYIQSTLRVISNTNGGCSFANWSCMANLCRADLGATAWRGAAGCLRQESPHSFICYFECNQYRRTY
jgi:hypothetical protein